MNSGSIFTFYTLSPLHAGSGESAGAVDKSIQREKHTNFPVVFSSSMKGSIKSFFYRDAILKPFVENIFGKDGDSSIDSQNGSVAFTDAKILLFPVRSSEGVFKWITCPLVIDRLRRNMDMIGLPWKSAKVPELNFGLGFSGIAGEVILEDIPIKLENVESLYKQLSFFVKPHVDLADFKNRLIIVSDDLFSGIVSYSTQIIARNSLDEEKKTSNNLWYEEVVPADTIFYTIVKSIYPSNSAIVDLVSNISDQIFHIGGNETIGYGFVKMSEDLSKTILGEISDNTKEEK